jgi:hypothetical protein
MWQPWLNQENRDVVEAELILLMMIKVLYFYWLISLFKLHRSPQRNVLQLNVDSDDECDDDFDES